MDTRPTAPPPRLMHKRPMRRVHQPDNAMVDIAGQVSHQMRAAISLGKFRHLRHRRQRISHPPRPRLRNINPRITIPLLARKRTGKNLRRVQRVVARSAKESPRTARCTAQSASRDTCTAPSRHRTSPPTAESRDAGTDRAWQTACHRSCGPAATEFPVASPSLSRLCATRRPAKPDTTRRR